MSKFWTITFSVILLSAFTPPAPAVDVPRSELTQSEIDQERIRTLWSAALERSPDIAFVCQKLGFSRAQMQAIIDIRETYANSLTVPEWEPNYPKEGRIVTDGVPYGQRVPTILDEGLAQTRKSKFTQSEVIMMFQMVRRNADGLIEHYRSYRNFIDSLADAKSVPNIYSQRKTIQVSIEKVREYDCLRSRLVDLCGYEAIRLLDNELKVPILELEKHK